MVDLLRHLSELAWRLLGKGLPQCESRWRPGATTQVQLTSREQKHGETWALLVVDDQSWWSTMMDHAGPRVALVISRYGQFQRAQEWWILVVNDHIFWFKWLYKHSWRMVNHGWYFIPGNDDDSYAPGNQEPDPTVWGTPIRNGASNSNLGLWLIMVENDDWQ